MSSRSDPVPRQGSGRSARERLHCCFSPGCAQIDSEELAAIFQDFSSGFGEKLKGENSLIKKPVVIDMTAA